MVIIGKNTPLWITLSSTFFSYPQEILVYSYLKDKIELSKSNSDFYDLNELKYYCVVSNQELMDFIQCGKTKIIQIKNNLEKIGLIKQVRQMDKSNKIFVNDYKIQ